MKKVLSAVFIVSQILSCDVLGSEIVPFGGVNEVEAPIIETPIYVEAFQNGDYLQSLGLMIAILESNDVLKDEKDKAISFLFEHKDAYKWSGALSSNATGGGYKERFLSAAGIYYPNLRDSEHIDFFTSLSRFHESKYFQMITSIFETNETSATSIFFKACVNYKNQELFQMALGLMSGNAAESLDILNGVYVYDFSDVRMTKPVSKFVNDRITPSNKRIIAQHIIANIELYRLNDTTTNILCDFYDDPELKSQIDEILEREDLN